MKKTNKIISILLVLVMMLTMAPLSLTASAATPTPYDGVPVTPQKISSGNYARLGLTSSNWSQFKGYYAIRNAKELYGFADIVNNTLAHNTNNLNAVLLQDIVINANGGNTYDWRPLYGTGNNRDYRGIIDGNGHYISGIYCTQAAYKVSSTECVSGLIGEFEGTVKNLIIKDSTFAPSQHLGMNGGIGAITGYPQDCTIINCRVENTKISSIDKYGQLGGIAGYGNGQGSTIKNCASINVTFSGGGYNAPISNFAPFSDCYTSASDSHTCSNISVEHKEVKATCEYPGLSNYKYCLVCGNITSGTKTETPATGHTWTPATCQAPKTCSSCGLTEGSAETHKYTTYTLSSNAMCGTEAQETASCDYGCGTTDTREISGTALVHSYTYSASGNTITAVCANGENCPNPQSTLKILAPAELYTDGTISREAVIDNQLVEATDYTVSYSTADGSAPKTAGTYTASVTIGGATASIEFTLLNYLAKVTDKDGNEIEGSPYKNLADAITAASSSEGSILTLLDDITVAKELDIESGKFTLDLNGKNLVSERGRVIESYAVLTIKDSGEGGTIYGKGGGGRAIINRGTLTFESGTVKGDGGIENRGTLTFNNGTVEAGDYSAISNYNMVYVYDGVFRSTKNSGINNYGTAFVYGGESSGVLNEGTAYISGGEFKGNSYAALNLNSGTVEITGGSFSGTDREDGIFTGVPYGEWTVDYKEGATLTLKGGEFPNGFTVYGTTANTLLAEGYAFHDANGNKITVAADATNIDGYVQVKDHYIARVTDKDGNEIEGSPFKTLEEAVTAASASEDSTLTLLDDVTLDKILEINSGKFTLELNGKTINTSDGIAVYAELTVDDSTSYGKIVGDVFGFLNDGSLIINGGIINASCAIYNYGTVYMVDGDIQGTITNNGKVTVDGGTLTRVENVNTSHEAVLEINGGTFTDANTIVNSDGEVTVSGGVYPNGFSITNDGVSENTVNSILADGYFCRDANGKIINVAEDVTEIEGYVKVTKGADFSADAVVTAEDVVYNGAAQEPDVTVTIGGKTLTEGKDYTLTFADNINAGTATVTVTSAGDYEGEIVNTFEIKKADSSIDVYPEANKLTYNGEAQTLIVIGDTYDGMIVYSLDGEKYSPLAPTGTNAGEYTVYYKVEGDSNHNDTEPETLTVTIGKKPVTVSATVPDRIYGDDYQVDTSKVVVTFDGVVDGDNVGYVVIDAYYHMHTVTDNAPVQVVYNVNGADAGNYQFPEYGDWMAPNYGVQAKGKVLPRDIADAQIVLGDALIYNGAEQTQSIVGVTVIGKDVTYTVSGNTATNVGVYELTITGNGNFSGETNALYEIAPDTTSIDALTVDNVKSSDKEVIEAVAQQIENAVTDLASDEKKAEYKAIADKCDELLAKIDATADEIARIDEAVNSYDKETVTSADIPALGKLIDDIKALTDGQNITEDEKSSLEENNEAIDELIEKLTEVAEEIKRVDEAVKSYDENSVKSTDSENLEQLKEDIQALIDSTNTTENEKTALGEMIKNIEGLEDKVEEIENQLEEIKGVENNFNPETVTSEDKAAIEEKIAEIESVNPDNLTEEQKAEYAEIKAGFEALLEEIEKAGSEVDAVGAELEMFDEEKATIFREDEIEALKAKIDELLADENMGEAEKAKLNEYKAQCDNLIEIINTPAKYLSMRLFYFIWDALHWLSSHVVFIFNWIIAMF